MAVSERALIAVTAIICITVLGAVYFVVVRQDSTVLTTLSGVIGGIVGYAAGKKSKK